MKSFVIHSRGLGLVFSLFLTKIWNWDAVSLSLYRCVDLCWSNHLRWQKFFFKIQHLNGLIFQSMFCLRWLFLAFWIVPSGYCCYDKFATFCANLCRKRRNKNNFLASLGFLGLLLLTTCLQDFARLIQMNFCFKHEVCKKKGNKGRRH